MANLRKYPPASYAYNNPSLSGSVAGDRTKRRRVECSHPVILEGMCFLCEHAVDDDHSLPFGYLHPSLRLRHEFADQMREVNTEATLGLRKLHLVLDLDHTLLHTTRLSHLTPEQEMLLMPVAEQNTRVGPVGGGDIFLVDSETGPGYITKLRPFVREFLTEAHKMFELTVYTMGGRAYSVNITKLLDPNREYFSDRVIAREDCTVRGRKRLDMVLAKESNVLILDDTETVWPDHVDNLIPIKPFYYFSHGSKKRRVWPSFGHGEGEHDSALVTAFQVLKEIHQFHFDPNLGLQGRDVREVLRWILNQSPRRIC